MTVRVLVTAGEPSGDLHAAHVIAALRQRVPDAVIEGVGGPHMAAAGAAIVRPIDGLSAMGLVEILHTLPAHLRLFRTLQRSFRDHRYSLVIVVDYPGFHLRLAQAARDAGIPVLWYIAPQLWAWHPGRARRLARAVNRLAVILPFEPAFFTSVGVNATYVGHPLLDRLAPPGRAEARAALDLPADARVLALFPGSRAGEIRRLWPAYRESASQLLARGACTHVVVAATRSGVYDGAERFRVVREGPSQVLAAADAVLAKSGTTTLEAALADVPMVVAYRMNPVTFLVARRIATVRWASLVNLIADREIVPEFFQGDVTGAKLTAALLPLLDPNSPERRRQRTGFAEVRRILGAPGASARVADLAAELLAA